MLTHSLLLIKLNFPEIFAQQQEVYLMDQLFASVKDIWQYFLLDPFTNVAFRSVEKRMLTLEWILHFPVEDNAPSMSKSENKQDFVSFQENSDSGSQSIRRKKKNMLYTRYKLFYPSVFDSLELKHAKLYSLLLPELMLIQASSFRLLRYQLSISISSKVIIHSRK